MVKINGTPQPDDRRPRGQKGGLGKLRGPEPHKMNVPVGQPRQLSAEEKRNMSFSRSQNAELGNLNKYWTDDGLTSQDILEKTKAGKDLLKGKSLTDITGNVVGESSTDENGTVYQKYKNGTMATYVDSNGQDVYEFTYAKDGSKLKITNKGQQTYYAPTGELATAQSYNYTLTLEHANYSETFPVKSCTVCDYEIKKKFDNIDTFQWQVYDANGNLGVTTYETGKWLKQSIKNGF